jgi:RNA polymerase sigma factor (sigma-70 family)
MTPLRWEKASDQELIDAIHSGDSAAAEMLFRQQHPLALRVAQSVSDASSADDIAAESIEKLLRAIQSGAGPTEAISPYLIRIVRNTAIDHHRKRRDTPTDFNETTLLPDVEDAADAVNDSVLVRTAFDGLPERWQAVLWLSHVEDANRHDIATQLGIKPGAVSQLAVRAREGLRQAYLAQYAHTTDESCKEFSGRLPAYVRHRTNESENVRLLAHLDDCKKCSRMATDLTSLNQHLGKAVAIALVGSATAAAALMKAPAAAVAATTPRRSSKRLRNSVAAGIAAAGLVTTGALALNNKIGTATSSQADSAQLNLQPNAASSGSTLSPTTAPSDSTSTTAAATANATATDSTSATTSPVADTSTSPSATRTRTSSTASTPATSDSPTPSSTTPSSTVIVGQPTVSAVGTLTVPITVTGTSSNLTAFLWFDTKTGHHLISSGWTCTSSSGGSPGGTAMECRIVAAQGAADLVMQLDVPSPPHVTIRRTGSPTILWPK